jgi:hypothetical protein
VDMTQKLDPTEKAQRREARLMETFATRRHAEHTAPNDWCRKCQANANARYVGIPEPYAV